VTCIADPSTSAKRLRGNEGHAPSRIQDTGCRMHEAEKERKCREGRGSRNRLSRVSALVPGDGPCPVAETMPDSRSMSQQPFIAVSACASVPTPDHRFQSLGLRCLTRTSWQHRQLKTGPSLTFYSPASIPRPRPRDRQPTFRPPCLAQPVVQSVHQIAQAHSIPLWENGTPLARS